MLAQEALCITLHHGQEPCKALPRTDKQCLVWIKRKNKALRIIEADEEKTQDSKMRAKEDYCFEPLMWPLVLGTMSTGAETVTLGEQASFHPGAVKAKSSLGPGN